MRRTLEQIEKNLINDDRLLLLMLVEEQRKTNHLLSIIVNEKEQEDTLPSDTHINDDLDSLKRPELMKLMAKREDKPQGWNKWETEEMRNHLKGVSSNE